MAISLKSIYEQTKDRYHLQLICGESGLPNIMNWVYISEDITTAAFLQGGELVITTGITSSQSPSWLFDFVTGLIEHKTCGLILNTGKYLFEESITEEVRCLCNEHHFPIFIMPWETRIFDITHDYYTRLFENSHTEEQISRSFIQFFHGQETAADYALLDTYGFAKEGIYHLFYIRTAPDFTIPSYLIFAMERFIKQNFPVYHLGKTPQCLFLAVHSSEPVYDIIRSKKDRILTSMPAEALQCGYSGTFYSLSDLRRRFFYAKAAASLAEYRKRIFYSFDEMGFIRILFSVSNHEVLEQYVKEKLGRLIEYDHTHNTDYFHTLYQYLLYNGSVQKIADELFCHRNTINYRIRILKEDFGIDFENGMEKFELMAAFLITEYLPLLKENGI